MSRSKFTPVGEVLPAVLRSLGLEKKFRELRLLEVWPDVVGPEISARTRPTRIEHKVLFVHVETTAEIHRPDDVLDSTLLDHAPQG